MDIVLFHGLQVTPNDMYHAWTSTWTQRGHDNVCWPREWLPCDLGEAVRIFSVSYDAHVLTSSHNHVSEIADNLFHNFVDRRYRVTFVPFSKLHLSICKKFVYLSVLLCSGTYMVMCYIFWAWL